MELNTSNHFRQVNEQCACFNMRKSSRAVTQFFDHVLEPAGIRATQFTLLASMASVSARTLTEMASSLVMDRTTLTRNLKPLEKMGLITTVHSKDKRSKSYALTDKGQMVLSQGEPLWQKAQQKIAEGLGSERYSKLLEELAFVNRLIADL